ncbi:MAG: hypothetical protein ACLUDH_06915 [Faecalispora sporosphaeroides]|uniref:hypothetical protein n=1 Tax=Faecalispora sporosphaeroides TaxID=1549 RepID=UPI003994B0BB
MKKMQTRAVARSSRPKGAKRGHGTRPKAPLPAGLPPAAFPADTARYPRDGTKTVKKLLFAGFSVAFQSLSGDFPE